MYKKLKMHPMVYKPNGLKGQKARWAEILHEYDARLRYRKG